MMRSVGGNRSHRKDRARHRERAKMLSLSWSNLGGTAWTDFMHAGRVSDCVQFRGAWPRPISSKVRKSNVGRIRDAGPNLPRKD